MKKICYENMITLYTIIERLYPNVKAIEIRDTFSEAIFRNILDENKIDAIKRNTNKNAFYNGNIRVTNGRRSFFAAKPIKKFREALEEPSLRKRTYTQLISNCKNILFHVQQDGISITSDFFDFLNDNNTYSEKLCGLIHHCIANKKPESALALTIIIAIFQEESPRIISVNPELLKLLTTSIREKSLKTSVIYKAATDVLECAASEQGRMLAFRDTKNKIEMPKVGAILPDILGKNKMKIDSLSSEQAKPLEDFFKKAPYSNIVLTGCGGSGKTFSLIHLGEKLLHDKDDIIPFYIPLNALNTKRTDDASPVFHYFLDIMLRLTDITEEALLDYLKSDTETTILFLLDGYNEITDSAVKTNLIAEMKRMKKTFHSVRFVLTGRYDISESFATGGKLPFCTKQLLPLSDTAIRNFLKIQNNKNSAAHWDKISHSGFLDILRNPMALAMYAHVCTRKNTKQAISDINPYLPYSQPETLGELIGNFMEQIKCTPSLKGNPEIRFKVRITMDILYYIAYKMALRGKYRITEFELNRYFSEAVIYYRTYGNINIPENFYPMFFSIEKKMGFLVRSQNGCSEYRFYHQDFRDYFYAQFLLQTIQYAVLLSETDSKAARTFICSIFSQDISDEILKLFGETALERTFLPEYGRDSKELSIIEQGLHLLQGKQAEPAAHQCIALLIRAAQLARKNDMSSFHFDGLDLTNVSLSGASLYSVHEGRIFTASFHDAFLNESTFMPNGHMAAVHTFSRIKDQILSISANAIWSYDTKSRSNKFIASCNGTYVTVSAYAKQNQLLFTGDKNGWVRIWQYAEDSSENISLTECTELAFNLSDIIRQIIVDEKRDLCLIGAKGSPICQFSIKHPEQKQYILLCENILHAPKYKFLLIGEYLYLACGLSVYRVKQDALKITEHDIFMKLEYEEKNAYIYDFKFMQTALDEYFIFNIRGNVSSAVKMISNTECHTVKTLQHTEQWNGFNEIEIADNGSEFCICNRITGSKYPAITVVTFNILRNDFVCHDYYGIQNTEIEDCCYVNQDEILFSSIDRSMQIINTRTESIVAQFPGYNPGIHHMHIYNSNTILACTYDGAFLRLQKSHMDGTWHCMQSKLAHNDWANEIYGFNSNGTLYAAICGNDCKISIWNTETEERMITIEADNGITSVCHLFGDYIFTTSRTGTITVYQLNMRNRTYTIAYRKSFAKAYLNFYAHFISSDTNSANLLILSVSAAKTSRMYKMYIQDDSEFTVEIKEIFSWKNTRIRTISNMFCADTRQNVYIAAGTRYLSSEAEYLAFCSDHAVIAEIVNERDAEYKKLRCDTMTENIGFLSCTFFSYNNTSYIAAASYSHMLHIYRIHDEKLTEVTAVHIGFPAIDIKYDNNILYLTTLSGKLLAIPTAHVLSEDTSLTELTDTHLYTVFQNLSGLYLNHVNLSDSHYEFSDEFKEIIRRYQTKL